MTVTVYELVLRGYHAIKAELNEIDRVQVGQSTRGRESRYKRSRESVQEDIWIDTRMLRNDHAVCLAALGRDEDGGQAISLELGPASRSVLGLAVSTASDSAVSPSSDVARA